MLGVRPLAIAVYYLEPIQHQSDLLRNLESLIAAEVKEHGLEFFLGVQLPHKR